MNTLGKAQSISHFHSAVTVLYFIEQFVDTSNWTIGPTHNSHLKSQYIQIYILTEAKYF